MANTSRIEFCRCGRICELKISWSPNNPGRRFFSCPIDEARGGCNYFNWYEPRHPEQANKVIYGLLKRVKAFEEEKARARRTRKKLVFGVVLLFAIWFLFWNCSR
ncbi:uncharacterized protein LOC132634283 [Lycium barbarum]|uniref:uncharacterized protein LOC132053804 n=1 Tax=Lycium ferocissimum TaxID=112874 RepID=UPI00281681D2|nr:uncharacterized protein LOC132053804 [Lycium ferocissimum]XP_060206538.1 uncharacterized protein LOC132634283 [Lycium barbarum]